MENILLLFTYDQQNEAMLNYRERWQMETMFKAFKTNGFNPEDTHLTDWERVEKQIAVVSFDCNRVYKISIGVHEHLKPIVIKPITERHTASLRMD